MSEWYGSCSDVYIVAILVEDGEDEAKEVGVHSLIAKLCPEVFETE